MKQENDFLFELTEKELQLYENNLIIKTVDYQDDFQYENGVLQFIAQPAASCNPYSNTPIATGTTADSAFATLIMKIM